MDHLALFRRARGVSLAHSCSALADASDRLRFAVSSARSGYSSGVALVSISLDEYVAHVRTTLELAGVARCVDAQLIPASDGEVCRSLVARVQTSLDLLCDSFDASSSGLGQSCKAGAEWDELNAPVGLVAFMAGYEVLLAGVGRHIDGIRQVGALDRLDRGCDLSVDEALPSESLDKRSMLDRKEFVHAPH